MQDEFDAEGAAAAEDEAAADEEADIDDKLAADDAKADEEAADQDDDDDAEEVLPSVKRKAGGAGGKRKAAKASVHLQACCFLCAACAMKGRAAARCPRAWLCVCMVSRMYTLVAWLCVCACCQWCASGLHGMAYMCWASWLTASVHAGPAGNTRSAS